MGYKVYQRFHANISWPPQCGLRPYGQPGQLPKATEMLPLLIELKAQFYKLVSFAPHASTCKTVNKSSKSKYLLYRLWSFVILLPVFYKGTGGYFPVNCPVNVLYPFGLPAFCARKTGGKSGFFKQVETLLRIYLLFLCHKISRACLPVKRSWGDGRKIKAVWL